MCLMGRSGARLLGQKTSGSYEQEYVRNGEGQASQKDKKDSSKHVGEPSNGGCSRPRDMICRQHEFVMGHHRDPTVLRPSSRCSQNSVNTGERIFLSTISSAKKRSKHSVSKHLSDALDYSLRVSPPPMSRSYRGPGSPPALSLDCPLPLSTPVSA